MRHALPIALVALAVVPFFVPSQFLVNVAMLTAVSAALGQAWNIAGGFGGLTSFGHAAFFGFGAYGAAILQTRYGVNPWLGLPVGAALGAGVGALAGWAAFRAGLRGSYFALATLAIAEAFRILANSLDFTRAGLGILVPLRVDPENFQFDDRRVFYALALGLTLLATGIAAWLTRSRFGARLIAVRENEDAARALGVNALRTKVLALALSGALTALGGVLYTQTYLYIDPNIAFGAERSVEMLLVAMIGGAGTVLGPILGAIALHAVADTSRSMIDVPGFAPMLYGVVLLLIIGFLPGGIARLRRA
ncbi:MAG TPA: branched-chain amino acid ABC transporter permease [Acetobacteraceae bacterium]|nr:branched-chain amino acid ABC transporter permease [Acetobacteraceae bacterium]